MIRKVWLPVADTQLGKNSFSWRIDTMQVPGVPRHDVDDLKVRNGIVEQWSDLETLLNHHRVDTWAKMAQVNEDSVED